LYQLALWFARARLYIGNDSGITHLAAAVGTPVVAVFGPTDPGVWSPRGERVRVVSCAGGWPGVDEVLAAAVGLLAEHPA
jgi:ADP-heptose:LPS heptosyltransferase